MGLHSIKAISISKRAKSIRGPFRKAFYCYLRFTCVHVGVIHVIACIIEDAFVLNFHLKLLCNFITPWQLMNKHNAFDVLFICIGLMCVSDSFFCKCKSFYYQAWVFHVYKQNAHKFCL